MLIRFFSFFYFFDTILMFFAVIVYCIINILMTSSKLCMISYAHIWKEENMNKQKLSLIMITLLFVLSGCDEQSAQLPAQVTINEYEPKLYETIEIIRGDLAPVLELTLEARDLEKLSYFPRYDAMEIDQVYVQVGDIVTAGDVLISFKSGDIEKQIESYQAQLDQQQLLLDHYVNLSAIDTTTDYSKDIEQMKADMEVSRLYIEGLNAKLDSYSIVAEGDGMVTAIADIVNFNIVNSNDNLITVVYDDGEYYATTSDDYEFVVGDIYAATYGVADYEMELVNITEDGKDVNGNVIKTLCFREVGNEEELPGVSMMNMTINKGEMKNVIYVPDSVIKEIDGKYHVYTLDENQCKHAVYVKTGISVDGYTVIEEGLTEGDKVVVK